jgi:hypothetical protein
MLMSQDFDLWGAARKTARGSGFSAVLVALGLAAVVVVLAIIANPGSDNPTYTAANSERVVPNTPPRVRSE